MRSIDVGGVPVTDDGSFIFARSFNVLAGICLKKQEAKLTKRCKQAMKDIGRD